MRRGYNQKSNRLRTIVGLIYLLFSVYFVSFKLSLIYVPEFILKINNWILFFGGLLLLFSAVNYFLPKKKRVIY